MKTEKRTVTLIGFNQSVLRAQTVKFYSFRLQALETLLNKYVSPQCIFFFFPCWATIYCNWTPRNSRKKA